MDEGSVLEENYCVGRPADDESSHDDDCRSSDSKLRSDHARVLVVCVVDVPEEREVSSSLYFVFCGFISTIPIKCFFRGNVSSHTELTGSCHSC